MRRHLRAIHGRRMEWRLRLHVLSVKVLDGRQKSWVRHSSVLLLWCSAVVGVLPVRVVLILLHRLHALHAW